MPTKEEIRQAVILAGGQGTRLRPLTNNRPKPMVLVNGRPFLEYLIELLKDNGIEEILLLLGYLPDKVIEHFGDGSRFGVRIKYSITGIENDTGTRIRKAKELLQERFLLMYCDNYWPLDLKALTDFWDRYGSLMTLTAYSNEDGITKNNVLIDQSGKVLKYDRSRKLKDLNGVEIGFFLADKKILELMPESDFSFEDVIIQRLIDDGQLRGYLTNHRYFSIGSIEKLPAAEKFLEKKKVIFLDRDGVINKKAPKADYIKKWEEFEFLPGALEAMKLLSQNEYEIYIISNQAGIARGIMAEEDLKDVHDKMNEELRRNGVTIKDVYYCPHGWDEGCGCRKPKPGMFFRAAREHFLDLTKAVFIGDDERDIEAGKSARCKTFLVDENNNLLQIIKSLVKK